MEQTLWNHWNHIDMPSTWHGQNMIPQMDWIIEVENKQQHLSMTKDI
jgi:hypothetical protein